MPDLRLTGRTVRRLRRALRFPPLAHVFWRIASADFDLQEMRARIPERSLDAAPTPIPGRAPHHWGSGEDLGTPTPTGGRQSGAMLRAAFAEGFSPEAVVDRILERHRQLGERSPFIEVDAERARAQARASAARYAEGKPLGPLDGLPIPIKDQFDMKGLPTRGGTTFKETPATEDSWVVQQLDRAGAIVIAKTHAVENGLNPSGVMEHFIGPRNPYRSDRAPGGSSTGSGVAVSLGLCPSSVGSDGGGSIRIPSALNGVFGLKPTYIRVGRTGDQWGSSTVAHIGPIGQTVADLVDQLQALAGVDPGDPVTRWAPDHHTDTGWRAALGRGIRGARIGVLRSELAEADPAIADTVMQAVKALESEGAEIVDVDISLLKMVNALGALIIGSESAANAADDFARHRKEFGHELAILYRMMKLVPASDYLLARRHRADLRRQVAAAFLDVDLLALPTTATVAPPYGEDEDKMAILSTSATAAMTRFNFMGNLTGVPAGTVPVGMHEGLPIGLQLVGDAWDEASVIAGMAHCERMGLADTVPRPPGFTDLLG